MRTVKNMFLLNMILIVINFNLILQSVEKKLENHYKTLNIQPTASQDEIKKAFKKLSVVYHPDKNKENKEEAKKMFLTIVNAYEVLSDSEKRKKYDKKLKNEQDEDDVDNNYETSFNFEDLFSSFFNQFEDEKSDVDNKDDVFKNTNVIMLNIENLSKFYKRKENWFVFLYEFDSVDNLFYVETENLINLYSNFADHVKEKITFDILKVGAVNCDYEKEICDELYNSASNVLDEKFIRLPSMIFFDDRRGVIYYGSHKLNEMINFINNQMINLVLHLSTDNYDDLIMNQHNFKVILFKSALENKTEIDIVIKFMAEIFHEKKINFYESTDKIIASYYKLMSSSELTYSNLLFVKDAINFKGSNIILNKIEFGSIKNFLNKEIKDYIEKPQNKFHIHEYIPGNFTNKKKCICGYNVLCGLFIIYKNNNPSKKLSRIQRSYLQNILSNNDMVENIKFCYIRADNLDNLSEIYNIENQFIDHNSKLSQFLFIKNKKIFIYKSNINFIEILKYIKLILLNRIEPNNFIKDEL